MRSPTWSGSRTIGTSGCARRTATLVSGDGKVRVIRSEDGVTWDSVALLDYGPEYDMRDAKLTVTNSGRLMLNTAAAPLASPLERQSLCWFSANGTDWPATPHEVGEPNWWLWSVAQHPGGDIYGIGYGDLVTDAPATTTRLYRSDDGVDYQTLVSPLTAEAGTNEAGLLFRQDGSAVVLVRRDGYGAQSLVGVSSGDYTNWTFHTLDKQVGGPEIIELPDGNIVAATRLYDGTVRTALSWLDPDQGEMVELLTLPSGGDTSYPGLVWRNDRLWCTYYSSHEGKANIYFAEVLVHEYTPGPVELVCQHRGNNHPATEGWTLYNGGAGTTEGPVTSDPVEGLDAWNISDTSTLGGSTRPYVITPTTEQMDRAAEAGWVLSARVRVIGSPDNPDSSIYAEYASNVDSLDRRFYMNLGSDANGDPIVALAGGPSVTLSGWGDGYHLYELKYDPTAGSAGLFVDGIEQVSDYAGIGNVGLARVMWGANQSNSTGTANYNYVLFRNSFIETIPGDANHDGAVDDVDASILASHWLRQGGVTWEDGDFNGDATVNDADAAVLAAHWGAGGAESAPQVPEPTTPTLLLGVGLLLGWRRLRRFA